MNFNKKYLVIAMLICGHFSFAQTRPKGSCDIYAAGGTPCVAAHSSTRALYAAYKGPLYQVMRQSDKRTLDIGLLADGYVNAAYRRLGIYKQLNEQLEQHYINLGVKRITRFTRVNNTRMIKFMEQQGYEVTRLLFEKWL